MGKKKGGPPKEIEERAKAREAKREAARAFVVKAKKRETGEAIEVAPRAMTKGQLRQLREEGLDPTFWEEKRVLAKFSGVDEEDQEKMAEAVLANLDASDRLAQLNARFADRVLELAYPEIDFDDVSNPACARLAALVYQATMGRGDEVKNS